jgi:hypothetical protein
MAVKQTDAPMSSKPRYVLIVTVEGLGTNLVGCYGSAIAPTKNLDRFACRSIVFDQFWSDTMRPFDILESMWTGTHFVSRVHDPNVPCNGLFERALLITDSASILDESTRCDFGGVLCIDSPKTGEVDEEDEPQTEMARLFEAALGQWATQLDDFPILWIHSRGLNGTWDAPYDYRCMMCDEGDPEPPFETNPGRLKLTAETDPDEVFGLACSMGGQAIVLDDAWAMIEEVLEQLGIAGDCLQVLAGVQGYPSGEHGWVGHDGQKLYAETLHLPLVVRPGNELNVGLRVPFMVQPNSILPTLAHWLEKEGGQAICDSMSTDLVAESEALPAEHWPIKNQLAYSCWDDQTHVAVPAWSCRWAADTDIAGLAISRIELFATPDDRWQQNEVSQRAQAVVEELTEHRDAWLKICIGSKELERVPLSRELTHPMR